MSQAPDLGASDRLAAARAAWRAILVHVQPEAEARPRVEAAADLASRLGATLMGVGAEMIPPAALSDPYGMIGGEIIAALAENVQADLRKAQEVFEAAVGGASRQWLAVQDYPEGALEHLARGADLVVVGGSPLNEHESWRWCDPAELAIRAGRPVLVVPPQGGRLAAKSILVAWKETREARRALADAWPLLAAADRVTLVEICNAEERKSADARHEALKAYLGRHGIRAETRIITADHDLTATTLQAQATDVGADLIVCGAYGHSRLGEWVFGGVTFDLLADPQRFLLISH